MEIVTKIAPIILALIMLGLGLGLKLDDFLMSFPSIVNSTFNVVT